MSDFSSYLYRLVNTQALQSLNVKHSVVEFALAAFVSMNAPPLTKNLFVHIDSPFPRAASARNTEPTKNVGDYYVCELEQDKANGTTRERLRSLFEIMPLVQKQSTKLIIANT